MAGAESASAESESVAGVLEGAFEVEASADAADGALAFAGNELPHLGQNLARGLQTAWHKGQFFSAAVVTVAAAALRSEVVVGGACRVPQRLQNLAFAASALPH